MMESQSQNLEFQTKQKLQEYDSLVVAYNQLENLSKYG
jgi:hypothetical protein